MCNTPRVINYRVKERKFSAKPGIKAWYFDGEHTIIDIIHYKTRDPNYIKCNNYDYKHQGSPKCGIVGGNKIAVTGGSSKRVREHAPPGNFENLQHL